MQQLPSLAVCLFFNFFFFFLFFYFFLLAKANNVQSCIYNKKKKVKKLGGELQHVCPEQPPASPGGHRSALQSGDASLELGKSYSMGWHFVFTRGFYTWQS